VLLTPNDEARLRAIERSQSQEPGEDAALASLVKQAAALCSAPAALFAVLGSDSVSIKTSFGCSFGPVLPRDSVLSTRVVETQRFFAGTFRRDDTQFRFFAGTPVFIGDTCIGSLGVFDMGDREITARDRNALAAIASAIGGILEERMRAAAPDPDLVETGLSFTDNAWMLFSLAPGQSLPRIEYANARVGEITGFSLEELTSNPQRFYDAAGYANAVLLAIERATTNDPSPAHVQVQAPDGSMIWLEGRARRLSDGRDGSLRFMTIARDITEQKQAEAFRNLLAEAIRRTPEALFIVRMKGEQLLPDVVYANEAFFALSGFGPSEYPKILGKTSNKSAVLDAVRDIHDGRSTEGETLLYRRDGTTFLAHYRSHPIDAPDRHAVIFVKDVTEERRQQGQLAMLSAAIEEAEDFVAVADDTPVERGGPFVVYVNPAIARASGYTPEELIGRPYDQLHSPNNPAKMADSVRESIRKATPGFRELLIRRKDGSDFWIEMVGRTFKDPATNRSFRLSVGRDITLRRRAFNQTALLLEASDQSSDAIVLYEPNSSGELVATYENGVSAQTDKKRLLSLWRADSECAVRIRETLESGGEIREVFAENDEDGAPVLVQFSARSVRNEARLEAIVTIERTITKANQGHEHSGQSLLLRVAAMLPALVHAPSTDERLAILNAILFDAFGAELQPSTAQLEDNNVHVATGWKGATFKLGDNAYAARWTRDLDSIGLTALRLCIEATIEENRKAATL